MPGWIWSAITAMYTAGCLPGRMPLAYHPTFTEQAHIQTHTQSFGSQLYRKTLH